MRARISPWFFSGECDDKGCLHSHLVPVVFDLRIVTTLLFFQLCNSSPLAHVLVYIVDLPTAQSKVCFSSTVSLMPNSFPLQLIKHFHHRREEGQEKKVPSRKRSHS